MTEKAVSTSNTEEIPTQETGVANPEQILEPGQVRYAYFWVHPQWKSPTFSWFDGGVDDEIQSYKNFIDLIKSSSRSALVQVADTPGEDWLKNPVYARFIEKMKEVDAYGVEQLGDRYVVWNESRFFDARDEGQVTTLVKKLKLVKSDQTKLVKPNEDWMAKEPKYLAKITVYGKESDTCSLGQAYYWKLQSLAAIVRYSSMEITPGVKPPTDKTPFPDDGMNRYVFDPEDK